jgi:hypothetical protein
MMSVWRECMQLSERRRLARKVKRQGGVKRERKRSERLRGMRVKRI